VDIDSAPPAPVSGPAHIPGSEDIRIGCTVFAVISDLSFQYYEKHPLRQSMAAEKKGCNVSPETIVPVSTIMQ
jgi:hypothetical protein